MLRGNCCRGISAYVDRQRWKSFYLATRRLRAHRMWRGVWSDVAETTVCSSDTVVHCNKMHVEIVVKLKLIDRLRATR